MPTAGDIFYFDSNHNGATSNPVVVLIHGAGGFHLHWPKHIRRINGYRVLALDLPGHGKSKGLGEQSIRGYAKKVVQWLDDIGVGSAIFVGHSMGGAIVQTLALEHTDYVKAMVLIGTGAKLPVNEDLLNKVSFPGNFDAVVNLILKWSYSRSADPKMVDQARKRMKETRPTVLHGDFLACKVFDVSERLSEIKVPTLVLVGEEDKMTPPSFSSHLDEQIKDTQMEILPGAGHMVMLEQEGEVAKVLTKFLDSLFLKS